MHLILSKNSDQSTSEVCEWFYNKKVAFHRINVDIDSSEIISFSKEIESNKMIGTDCSTLNCSNYSSIWYRRHTLTICDVEKNAKMTLLTKHFCLNRKQELNTLYDYFNKNLSAKLRLGNFHKVSMNKLYTLQNARKHNINIPESKIISKKKDLVRFYSECNNGLITKSIYEPIFFIDNNSQKSNISYTMELTKEIIDGLPDNFNPSLVQEKIDKDFEIRSFYLSGEFYSMAIFSQSNVNTLVDFRHYDSKRPNRTVPYLLPNIIKKNIIELMKDEELNCASIDIIKAKNGKYVFLEINPVGQFGMVSAPCNYNLEMKIFKFLINER